MDRVLRAYVMTAHAPKPTITPERIRWFCDYYRQNPAWGVFHVCLDDGNWSCRAAIWDPGHGDRHRWPSDLREAAEWFDALTPSQRRRLERKARDLNDTIAREVAR